MKAKLSLLILVLSIIQLIKSSSLLIDNSLWNSNEVKQIRLDKQIKQVKQIRQDKQIKQVRQYNEVKQQIKLDNQIYNDRSQIPSNYTQSVSIQLIDWKSTPDALRVIYSPDHNSICYTKLGSQQFIFRSGILQPYKQTKISITNYNEYLVDIKYSPQSNRLFILINKQTQYYLSYYDIKDNNIVNQNHLVTTISVRYQRAYLQVINNKYIALLLDNTLYMVKLSYDDYQVNITTQQICQSTFDFKHHPINQQIFFIACNQYTINSLIIYNSTSKSINQYKDLSFYSINIVKNGQLLLIYSKQSSPNDIVNVYTYSNGQINYIRALNGYHLMNQQLISDYNVVAMVRKTQNIVVKAVDIFEISYNQSLSLLLKTQKINSTIIKQSIVKQSIPSQSQSKQQLTLSINFKLITTITLDVQSYSSSPTIDGSISKDGNQIYLHPYLAKQILRYIKCPNGTYLSNGSCLNCSDDCSTCHTSSTQCTSCYQGTYYKNYTCVDCSGGCFNCTQTTCFYCSTFDNFQPWPVNNTCNCQRSTFRQSDNKCKRCDDTMIGCLQCSSINTCTKCDSSSNYVFDSETNQCRSPLAVWIVILIVGVGLVIIVCIGIVVNRACKKRKNKQRLEYTKFGNNE